MPNSGPRRLAATSPGTRRPDTTIRLLDLPRRRRPPAPRPSPLAPRPAHRPPPRRLLRGLPRGRTSPRGRGEPGRRCCRRRLASAQPHRPRPAPRAAAQGEGRRRRGRAGPALGRPRSPPPPRPRRRRRRAAGRARTREGGGRWAGEGGGLHSETAPRRQRRREPPSPPRRRPITLRGEPAGRRGSARGLRTPAPDVRSRGGFIPARRAEGRGRRQEAERGGAIYRPRPLIAFATLERAKERKRHSSGLISLVLSATFDTLGWLSPPGISLLPWFQKSEPSQLSYEGLFSDSLLTVVVQTPGWAFEALQWFVSHSPAGNIMHADDQQSVPGQQRSCMQDLSRAPLLSQRGCCSTGKRTCQGRSWLNPLLLKTNPKASASLHSVGSALPLLM
ncbi:uncharacterized protein LOC112132638 [Pongo abelii]|uniref:uncharacterized protein LOC112132638 n=1 Tax=Pongo abelii TaxID=9601 RepID=UPI0030066742